MSTHYRFYAFRIAVSIFTALLALFPVSFTAIPTVEAATLTVNTTADSNLNNDDLCSLREAITAANNQASYHECTGSTFGSDVITFSVTGVIRLTSPLPVISVSTRNLTISGPGADMLTISGDSDNDGIGDVQILTVQANGFRVENLTFAHGYTTGNGAALFLDNESSFHIVDCVFQQNIAGEYGGAVYYNATGGMNYIERSTFQNNQASTGGALSLSAGTMSLTSSSFEENEASQGGAIYLNSGNLQISQSNFRSNSADDGGGLYIQSGNTNLTECTFSNNTALNTGGAITLMGTNMTIQRSYFSANQAANGGAITHQGANVNLVNTTFYANTATAAGGAIDLSHNLNVNACTFAENSAPSGGSLRNTNITYPAYLRNSILAGNPQGGNCAGNMFDGGNNLSSDTSCNLNSVYGSLAAADPGLATPANNGGQTLTLALKSDRPAIDQVVYTAPNNCPDPDQRGVSRPQANYCDSGAFEFYWIKSYIPFVMR